ncbi:MAG: TolC family protein [Nitrospirae bacterium]|nr:MAG: TolC family protein [Nitrospirota bacterium]
MPIRSGEPSPSDRRNTDLALTQVGKTVKQRLGLGSRKWMVSGDNDMIWPHLAIGLLAYLVVNLHDSPARASEALTVEQAVSIALKHNPDLLAARQELAIAQGREVKARLLNRFNPRVRSRIWNRHNPGSGNETDSQVFIQQEVEVAGQRSLRIKTATRQRQRVEAQLRDRERRLIGEVKRAYFRARMLQEQVRLRRTIEELNRRIRDASKARFEAGVAPIMEANLAAIRYGQSRKESLTAQAAFEAALATLRRLLGWDRDRALVLAEPLRVVPRPVSLPDLLQRALTTRPDLVAAKHEIARAQADIELTKRLIIPNPTFQGFYNTETEGPGGTSTMLGGGISIPLPLFDRKQGELIMQGGTLERSRHRLIAITRLIEQEVETAFQTYEAARRAVEVFETEVLDRIHENFRFIELAYREGKIGLLQLIVVQDDLITAQLSYVESLGQFRQAQVDLEQAVGGTL